VYQSEAGAAAPITADDVYNNVIKPMAVGLDKSKLSYSLTPNPDLTPGNTVTVTVTYRWYPEAYLVGPINLTCSSTRTVNY
jgi:hypothetical protein